jgi:hypothetical protein
MGGRDVRYYTAAAAADMAVGGGITIIAAVAAAQLQAENPAIIGHTGQNAVNGRAADGGMLLVNALVDSGGGRMSAHFA